MELRDAAKRIRRIRLAGAAFLQAGTASPPSRKWMVPGAPAHRHAFSAQSAGRKPYHGVDLAAPWRPSSHELAQLGCFTDLGEEKSRKYQGFY
jgi:hypothetical protein